MDPNRTALPFREFSHRISLVFMLTLAAALLLLGRAETYVFDRARQVVTDLAAPLLEVASRPVAATRRIIERTDEYAYVFDENERLRAENARLLAWKEEAQKLQGKVARFEALLNVQVDPSINYVSGRAVSDSGGPFVDTVRMRAGYCSSPISTAAFPWWSSPRITKPCSRATIRIGRSLNISPFRVRSLPATVSSHRAMAG